ncbi:hypothetical protein IEQ34_019402 [Dendrobium chrysotoxum]|uniref:Uncharacterized protein n=1 Tax=Dendrobium chrysotoxum TaxID=161865 RepID=A0AAV7G9V1_DENCH|nr:hypothetical protein IEQ34_019402 [Dendrobium chrysotoxum]
MKMIKCPHILHELGSFFGHPIRSNNASSNQSRPSVARVFVKLDISKCYPDNVWLRPKIFGYIQHVGMEEFSPLCEHCETLGHHTNVCFSLLHHVDKNLMAIPKPITTIAKGNLSLGLHEGTTYFVNTSTIEEIVGTNHVVVVNPFVPMEGPTLAHGGVDVTNRQSIISISCYLISDDVLLNLESAINDGLLIDNQDYIDLNVVQVSQDGFTMVMVLNSGFGLWNQFWLAWFVFCYGSALVLLVVLVVSAILVEVVLY